MCAVLAQEPRHQGGGPLRGDLQVGEGSDRLQSPSVGAGTREQGGRRAPFFFYLSVLR